MERGETVMLLQNVKCLHKSSTYCLWQHDRFGVIVHWVMCKKYGFSNAAKWCEQTPELENNNVKILWNFSIQTDHKLGYNKPSILIVDKQAGECHIIDIVCPFDIRGKEKQQKQ